MKGLIKIEVHTDATAIAAVFDTDGKILTMYEASCLEELVEILSIHEPSFPVYKRGTICH